MLPSLPKGSGLPIAQHSQALVGQALAETGDKLPWAKALGKWALPWVVLRGCGGNGTLQVGRWRPEECR